MTEEPQPLPALMDIRTIEEELGVKRRIAEAIMQQLPKVTITGRRRVFVRRDDVQKYIDERTGVL